MVFYYYHLPHNSSFPNKWIFLFKKINKIIHFFFFFQLWAAQPLQPEAVWE